MDDLARLVKQLRADQARTDATRAELHAAILAALAAGTRQVDVARSTGYSRERLRQLARNVGQNVGHGRASTDS